MMNNQLNGNGMEPVDARWNAQETVRNFPESVHTGLKTQQLSQPLNVQKEGQPSNVLWVGYPPSVHVDEQMLYRAMILFGEIEKIKVFPSRFYSFVEFRSIDEARRAKEGLQGRLFNDPRITINYSSSELSPGGDHTSFYPAVKGRRPDGLVNDNPLRSAQMDTLSHSRPMAPNMLPHPSPKRGMEPELNDLANNSSLMGPVWRRPSPPPHGLLPLTSGIGPPNRRKSSTWDVLDANQFQRDPKRPRMDGGFPLEQPDRLEMPPEQAASASPAVIPGRNRPSPADARVVVGPVRGRSIDYIWRGIIAKGGSAVCHARCIPIGKGLESQLLGAVNCSARTGLEMLAKHFTEAIGFDIVFFLPDSEDDFAPYTEFFRYLGDKNRAGVAKLADGTTLFLVPPSEFLTEVLKVSGPERLYGVVLKMPEHMSDSASMLHPSPHSIPPSQYVGRQLPPQYNPVTQEEQRPPLDYESVPSINTQIDPKIAHETPADNHAAHAAPHDYSSTNVPSSSSSYPSNVTVTPELVATLASLIPPNSQPSEFSHPSTITAPVWKQEYGGAGQAGMGVPPQWKHEYAASEQTAPGNLLHPQMGNQAIHSGNQLIQRAQHPTAHHNYLAVPGSQMQDPAFDRPQPAAISHQSVPDFTSSSDRGHFPALQQPSQHYQLEGQGPTGFYGLPAPQQSGGHMILPQAQVLIPSVANKENPETANHVQQLHSVLYGANQGAAENEGDKNQRANHVQQLHSVLYGANQGAAENEGDKNERYQSTLQFAANLLLQIRQKQQQQQQSQTEQGVGERE